MVRPRATIEKLNFIELHTLSPPKTTLTGSCLLFSWYKDFSLNLLKTALPHSSRFSAHRTWAWIIFLSEPEACKIHAFNDHFSFMKMKNRYTEQLPYFYLRSKKACMTLIQKMVHMQWKAAIGRCNKFFRSTTRTTVNGFTIINSATFAAQVNISISFLIICSKEFSIHVHLSFLFLYSKLKSHWWDITQGRQTAQLSRLWEETSDFRRLEANLANSFLNPLWRPWKTHPHTFSNLRKLQSQRNLPLWHEHVQQF